LCRNKWIGPTSALHRSLFCSVHRTTDQDSGLGPTSYTQHYCISWWNPLQLTFCINISHTIKHFASVIISAQVLFFLQGQKTKWCKAGIHQACWYSFSCSTFAPNNLIYSLM
jgi:hypothetical protein